MNKKLFTFGLMTIAGIASISTTNAFFGKNMDFAELKAMILQYDNAEDFHTAMKAKHEAMRAEHQVMREQVTKTVENISNGVRVTKISDNPEVVEKLQSHEMKESRNESITRTKNNISNGIEITITSTDPEVVEKIQNREIKKGKRGHKFGRKGKHGFGQRRSFQGM